MNRFENKREKSFHDKLKLKLNFKAYPLIVFIKIRILILAFIVETKYMMDRNLQLRTLHEAFNKVNQVFKGFYF